MSTLTSKPVRESLVEVVQIVRPEDANPLGLAFGGKVVQWMDMAAAIAAIRHARTPVVTASIDSLSFLSPIKIGDFVIIRAQVNYTGKTSMEVGVTIDAESPFTGRQTRATSGYLTFVALDERGRPIPVPPVLPETPEEQRLYAEAQKRRAEKLKHRFESI